MEIITRSEPFEKVIIMYEPLKLDNNTYTLSPKGISLGKIDKLGNFHSEDGKEVLKSYKTINSDTKDLVYGCTMDLDEIRNLYQELNDVTALLSRHYQLMKSSFAFKVKDGNLITYINNEVEDINLINAILKTIGEPVNTNNIVVPNKTIDMPNVIAEPSKFNADLKNINIVELEKYVKERVLYNDSNIEDIVTTIGMNYHAFDPDDIESMLSVGPTGSGKSHTYKVIAEYLGVPTVLYDCNSMTAAGYKGEGIEDALMAVYERSGHNIDVANKSILVFDEIDKLRAHGSDVKDVDVQSALLKTMEGYKYYIEATKGRKIEMDTSFMTIAACGAFSELYEEKKKQKTNKLGFGVASIEPEKETNTDISFTVDDFVKYGMKRELMGRFTEIYEFKELNKDALMKILIESKTSPLLKKQKRYEIEFGTILEWEEEYAREVIEQASKLGIGGRGLKRVVASSLKKVEYRLQDVTQETPKRILLTKETVHDNKKYKI